MRAFDAYLSEKLKDPEFKAEYEALDPEFAIIGVLIEARKNTGLTQKELAEKPELRRGILAR